MPTTLYLFVLPSIPERFKMGRTLHRPNVARMKWCGGRCDCRILPRNVNSFNVTHRTKRRRPGFRTGSSPWCVLLASIRIFLLAANTHDFNAIITLQNELSNSTGKAYVWSCATLVTNYFDYFIPEKFLATFHINSVRENNTKIISSWHIYVTTYNIG